MEGNHLQNHIHRHVHGLGARHVHGLGPRVPTRPVNHAPLEQRDALPNLTSMLEKSPSHLLRRKDCEPGDNSPACEKPVGGTLTGPVTIAVVIPVIILVGVLLYLHRKTTRRHAAEMADDKYKSMDFGSDTAVGGKSTKRKSTLFGGNAEKGLSTTPHHTKGLSMDMNLSSPYLLPPEIQQSRESLNSLAKTIHQHEDPYRHIKTYTHSDSGSIRSVPKDRESSFKPRPIVTTTTALPSRQNSLPTSPLPTAPPAAHEAPRKPFVEPEVPSSAPPAKSEFNFTDDNSALPQVPSPFVDMPSMPELTEPAPVARKDASPSPIPAGLAIVDPKAQPSPPPTGALPETPRGSRKDSRPVVSDVPSEYEDYANFQFSVGEDEPDTPEDRGRQASRPNNDAQEPAALNVPQKANNRLSVGQRPLPPDDALASDDPEARAMRIRSFYKEYFEESKEERPPMPPLPPQGQRAQYVEDYDTGYMGGDAAFYDPDSNAFVMPYAEPITRRAMTPPPSNRRPMPGGPGPRGPGGPHGSFSPGPRGPPRPRAGSTISSGPGRFGMSSPRPGSSASGQMGPRANKKPLPPPSALSTLPTPAKLRDDTFLISNPIDFAPPPTFKDQAAGRSQSPLGERRPYQLAIPIASPIASSFDEMSALPSPVRSMGSGISSAANSAIRNGAGRVSRLPGDQVFTNAAMGDELKPKWGMRH
ncbi:hypothetical protein PG993_008168 [Apiospora rasikravindrae]|uniref:Uncharacterized protein n=1 Tax=Apiospora rasikravindrae TaxID=990691 RepID=A0ABR1SZY1_9PEZI